MSLNPIITHCQKSAYVYKSYVDYSTNNLSESISLDNKKNKIIRSSFERLVVKSDGKKTIYKPGELYGYFDGAFLYRYFNMDGSLSNYGYFKVRDTTGLIFYSQRHFNGYSNNTYYYYSRSMNDPIKYLNMKNLKSEYNNTDFLNQIESKVNKIKNMNPEKASLMLKEINAAYNTFIH